MKQIYTLSLILLAALVLMGNSCDNSTTPAPGPVFELTRVDVRAIGGGVDETLVNVLEPLEIPHYISVLTLMMQCYNELPIASQHMHVYEVLDDGVTRLLMTITGYNDPPFGAFTPKADGSRADGGWTTGFTVTRGAIFLGVWTGQR